MAFFKKEHLKTDRLELERFYNELTAVLEGIAASANVAHLYHCDTEQFARDYVEIDMARLNCAIGHFKVSVDNLKKLKEKAQKTIQRG